MKSWPRPPLPMSAPTLTSEMVDDGGDAQPGQDRRQRERELDREQAPRLAVAHRGGGVRTFGRHAAKALDEVADEDHQGVDRRAR